MPCFETVKAPQIVINITSSNNFVPRTIESLTMADKVKEVAVGEADRIKSLTVQAARSAAYLYPIKASCQTLPVVKVKCHSLRSLC